jgi:hypothetical protein
VFAFDVLEHLGAVELLFDDVVLDAEVVVGLPG